MAELNILTDPNCAFCEIVARDLRALFIDDLPVGDCIFDRLLPKMCDLRVNREFICVVENAFDQSNERNCFAIKPTEFLRGDIILFFPKSIKQAD